ncbi:MAG TPA: polysaccharide lyase family 8 super-sandwich domain-containing protein, partial [Bacteroidales bacterium]|nr:polysaccharide lyase family 8 super-sandwich domain-containing protein [Bacteroidales bacterium]
MRPILKYIFILFTGLLFAINSNAAVDDVETLRQRFISDQMIPEVKESLVRELMKTIKLDGTWPDINYQDVSRTAFQHGKHLSNMVAMARAFKKKGTKLYGDKKLESSINSSLDYWLANDFICENWWWNQIGTPNAMISFLLIMDKDLTPVQIEKAIAIVGRANLDASGARPSGDRIKIAGILAKNALFTRNKELFEKAIRVIEGEIKFSTERGMQYDYSFHHREDWVNNTMSYGTGYADAFAEWAANVAGTRYKFSDKSARQLIDYYLDGICKQMIYGKQTDPGVMNRDVTRKGEFHVFSTVTPERLLKVSDYRKAELETIVKLRRGEIKPELSFSKFFWNSEHFAFQRPDFYTSVRMHSIRNRNMEEPYNGEGLMNHHRGDGTNYISRTGKEYADIAPIYDWQKIPGATILQKPALPSENEIQKDGLTEFVGAVSDGKYGAVAYDFRSPHDPLRAKKAWFFFDNEYVCLGSEIIGNSGSNVATTLNQCWLNGKTTIMSGAQKQDLPKGEERVIEDAKWVYHDSIGYFFPQPATVNVSNQQATGSWFLINRQTDSPKDEIRGDVFKLWIDHGKRPKGASYQYVILPSVSEKDLEIFSQN